MKCSRIRSKRTLKQTDLDFWIVRSGERFCGGWSGEGDEAVFDGVCALSDEVEGDGLWLWHLKFA